jgi:hypothetical protein
LVSNIVDNYCLSLVGNIVDKYCLSLVGNIVDNYCLSLVSLKETKPWTTKPSHKKQDYDI